VDRITPAQRSRNMARVRAKDTTPELTVRRLAHRMGYRYRLHAAGLPGKPDIVFPARRKLIFVHGCFWHGHTCRSGTVRPQANAAFWVAKLDRNKERDARNLAALAEAGWAALVVWGCELRDVDALRARLAAFLGERGA
jgi:DNA mismatch endonuclease (patch repair protein)